MVARVLDIPDAYVTCETRRMGGGFGGKESQATQWAVDRGAGGAHHGPSMQAPPRPRRRFHPHRQAPRFPLRLEGRLRRGGRGPAAIAVEHLARCGYSADLSGGVVDRAMFHSDNAYFMPAVHVGSKRLKTNTVSNTAFRGFGGPQGMLAIEHVMDQIAWATGRDPLDVRYANFYRPGRNLTPLRHGGRGDRYAPRSRATLEQTVELPRAARRRSRRSMPSSPIMKRGLALTPVKFGISFTLAHLNQAGALVHVYQDGSVHLNHGGTEMGQGLYIKVAQVVAEEFGIALERVRITATTTAKVPNTSPTAASSGSDLNGMAARIAAGAIKRRMIAYAAEAFGVAGGADRIPRRPRLRRQREPLVRRTREEMRPRRACSSPRRAITRRRSITWDRAKGHGPPVLLLRLWRGLLGGDRRHAHRREPTCGASTSSTMSDAR